MYFSGIRGGGCVELVGILDMMRRTQQSREGAANHYDEIHYLHKLGKESDEGGERTYCFVFWIPASRKRYMCLNTILT